MIVTPMFRFDSSPIFTRYANRHVIFQTGRWGPKWLHRLIWRMVRNTGMLGCHVEMTGSKITRYDLPDKPLRNLVMAAALEYITRDFDRDDLVIYCGNDIWHETMMDRSEFMSGTIGEHFGQRDRRRYMNIPVIIVPNMSGALVVPRPERVR